MKVSNVFARRRYALVLLVGLVTACSISGKPVDEDRQSQSVEVGEEESHSVASGGTSDGEDSDGGSTTGDDGADAGPPVWFEENDGGSTDDAG